LVGATIPDQRRLDCFTEGAIEGRCILRGVGEDRKVFESCPVEGVAHGSNLAIHHSREAEQLGARIRLGERHLAVDLERRVVVDHKLGPRPAAGPRPAIGP
jgi:hypothetical protein